MKSIVTTLGEAESGFWDDVSKKISSGVSDTIASASKKALDYVTPKENPAPKISKEDLENKLLSGETSPPEKSIVDRFKDKVKSTQAYKDIELNNQKFKQNEINRKGLDKTSYDKTLGVLERPPIKPPAKTKEEPMSKLTPTQSNVDADKDKPVHLSDAPSAPSSVSKPDASTITDKIVDTAKQYGERAKNVGSKAIDLVTANPTAAAGIAGATAAAGLGYLAYKKMRQKQAARKAALA